MIDARVVVLRDFGVLEIEELSLPEGEPHQAVLELLAAGVQPAQLKMVQQASEADGTDPCVPGLEAVGWVRAIGSGVTRVKEGDLVVVGPHPAKGSDRALEWAPITFQDDAAQLGRPVGVWATNALVDEQLLTRIPGDTRDPERMAFVGDTILSALAAVVRGARVKRGDSVAVFGVGGSGLAAIGAAKALGAFTIIAVGRGADALARATTAGATETIDLAAPDVEARVRSLSPRGLQCVVDCRDEHGSLFAPTAELLAPDGRAFLIAARGETDSEGDGIYTSSPPADPESDIALLITWMNDGLFDPAKLVRKRYTIEQINEAVGDLEFEPGGQIVLVVEPLR